MLASEGIQAVAVGQRPFRSRVLLFRVLRSGQTTRLGEADVDVVSDRPDVGLHAVEHRAVCLVLVEAQLEVGAQQPAALRNTVEQRKAHRPGERIRGALVVGRRIPKKAAHVAERRQA